MTDRLDQIFVLGKQWLLGQLQGWGLLPADFVPLVSALFSIIFIVVVFAGLFAITTVIERKGLGRIQNRLGPNRVGLPPPFPQLRLAGFGQFIADGIKALIKEDIVPRAADRVVHFLAPVALVVPVLLAYSVLPFGRNMTPIELEAGLLFFFAVGAATELSLFMAGWSSRNKYSLLGAMRAVAQMISYEIPLVLSSLTVVMMVGSLSLPQIVAAQDHYTGTLAHWHIFKPWGFAGCILFLIAALAESNRSPFDLPEAESEIIAGYFVEYSGFKFALFFLGEYLGLFAVSGLGVTLFLGGWTAPFSWLTWIPSWLWFFFKLCALIAVFIWIRGTVPRLRADQLMGLAWKFMLPMALWNIVVAAAWHFTHQAGWHLIVRWLFCAALLVGPYLIFGRAFEAKVGKRTYRYAP
ncbi:MAG TPA: NADH-quinone oxidoreductase subunit NuoH [Verrucomicrobiae bacterium]|nr:NADH-quinone oxidoreductase subunit NuoH [Verrucomicrobiae bacterium]